MSVTTQPHPEPWSEEEFFALGETANRIELFDGSLWANPSSSKRHQRIVFLLAMQLDKPAAHSGLVVLHNINLRLSNGRVFEPDLVVADTDEAGNVVEAGEAKLVVEVVSPGNAGTDRPIKPQLYAEAGIGWYLRVEQPEDSVELHLQKLNGDHYEPHSVVRPGESLVMTDPFPVTIDVSELLPRR